MQKRNTNIELMRMICMFLIIMHHAILYSDVLSNSGVSLNKYIAAILYNRWKVWDKCFLLYNGLLSDR